MAVLNSLYQPSLLIQSNLLLKQLVTCMSAGRSSDVDGATSFFRLSLKVNFSSKSAGLEVKSGIKESFGDVFFHYW